MYNVQAKGPKGQKITFETKIEDPHVLSDIVDPVFSGEVQLQGIKHRYLNHFKHRYTQILKVILFLELFSFHFISWNFVGHFLSDNNWY